MIQNIIRFVVVLGLVCLVTGSGVAVLYAVFKGDLAKRETAAAQKAILEVCPGGATVNMDQPVVGKPFAPDAVYAAKDAGGKTVAYIAGGEASGYSSVVKIVLGARADDLAVTRVVVLAQGETPGLGATIADTRSTYTLWQKLLGSDETERLIHPFIDDFAGKKPDQFGQVHAITAATITSNAVKAAAEQAVGRIRQATERTK